MYKNFAPGASKGPNTFYLPVGIIDRNKNNPSFSNPKRKHLTRDNPDNPKLKNLMKSLSDHGQLVPVVVVTTQAQVFVLSDDGVALPLAVGKRLASLPLR